MQPSTDSVHQLRTLKPLCRKQKDGEQIKISMKNVVHQAESTSVGTQTTAFAAEQQNASAESLNELAKD